MRRVTPIALGLLLLTSHVSKGDETPVGSCTIVNTEDHPVVIGLYKPSTDGISERLVSVPPRTELYDVPIPVSDDAQFVIAYSATMEGDEIRRAVPIVICGHKRLRFLKNNRRQVTLDAMIEYRGGSGSNLGDDRNIALYLPDSQVEAREVLRRANRTSTPVPPSLTRTKFVDGSNSQRVKPANGREPK